MVQQQRGQRPATQRPSGQRPKKRKKKRKFLLHRFIIFILVCLLLVFAVRFAVSSTYREQVVDSIATVLHRDGDTGLTANETPLVSEAVPATPKDLSYTKLKAEKMDYKKGDLILVNGGQEYDFVISQPDAALKNLLDSNNEAYPVYYDYTMVAERMITPLNTLMADFQKATGIKDVTILSGFRTKEYQQELYDQKVQEEGQAKADEWVAKAGFSEHHTGLCVDFSIENEDGALRYSEEGDYDWLLQNAHRYGFVKRYEDSKTSVTKIMNEPWHYRYVGKPHAYLMQKNSLCLEEYLAALKNYPYKKDHLMVTTDDGEQYEIYYVGASQYKKIPVPENYNYNISGNNVDGFIVTVDLTPPDEKAKDAAGQDIGNAESKKAAQDRS